jgi:cell division protein FtsL
MQSKTQEAKMNSTKTAVFCLWFSMTIFMAFGTFVMKNYVADLEKELVQINQKINDDVKSIHILKAEWSHLNNPERLRNLASKHIALEQVKPEQIINYASLPFDYETDDATRKMIARQNVVNKAIENKELRKLAKVQR